MINKIDTIVRHRTTVAEETPSTRWSRTTQLNDRPVNRCSRSDTGLGQPSVTVAFTVRMRFAYVPCCRTRTGRDIDLQHSSFAHLPAEGGGHGLGAVITGPQPGHVPGRQNHSQRSDGPGQRRDGGRHRPQPTRGSGRIPSQATSLGDRVAVSGQTRRGRDGDRHRAHLKPGHVPGRQSGSQRSDGDGDGTGADTEHT